MLAPPIIFAHNYHQLQWNLQQRLKTARIRFCKALNSLALVAQLLKWKLFQNYFTQWSLHPPEFKKSFQREIYAAPPQKSLHSIGNLHVKETNQNTSLDISCYIIYESHVIGLVGFWSGDAFKGNSWFLRKKLTKPDRLCDFLRYKLEMGLRAVSEF